MLDDGDQPAREASRLGERQGLDGAAQRGQRVLQLVRDVGGEALDRLDAVVERLGHVAQGAGQMADLVGAVGEVGDLLARLDAVAHPLGGLGQAAHRPGDGAGEEEREHDRHGRGDGEDAQDGEALGGDDLVDLAGRVESSSTPSTALKRWIGTATETIVSPCSLTRTRVAGEPVERGRDLGIALAVARAELLVERQVLAR